MKYNYIIFDLDGTLLNTLDDLRDSTNFALRRFGFPERTTDEVRRFVGNGVARLIHLAVPEGTDEKTEADCLAVFKAHYKDNMTNKTAPYPGIIELLKKLRALGVKIAVVSNKFEPAVVELCEDYFGGLVDAAVGQTEDRQKKPAPDGVLYAMKLLGADPARTVYSGDSDVDVLTARNSNLPCIGVSWGFRERRVLEDGGLYCRPRGGYIEYYGITAFVGGETMSESIYEFLWYVNNIMLALLQGGFLWYNLTPKFNKHLVFLITTVPFVFLVVSQKFVTFVAPSFLVLLPLAYYFICAAVLYKDKFRTKAFVSIAIFALESSFSAVVASMLNLFGIGSNDPEANLVLTPFLLVYTVIFLVFTYFRKRKLEGGAIKPTSMLAFIIFPLSQMLLLDTCMILLNHFDWAGENSPLSLFKDRDRTTIIIFAVVAIFSIAADVILFYVMNRSSQNEKLREELKMQEYQNSVNLEYYKNVEKSSVEARKIRHDLANMVQTACEIMENGTDSDKESAKKMFAQLKAEVSDIKIERFCQNTLVNAIASNKAAECRKNDIDFDFDLRVPETLDIEEIDICKAYVNIFDNAINAAKAIDGKRYVKIKSFTDESDRMLYITGENNVAPDYEDKKKSRTGEHGYGLRILRDTAEKYGGRLVTDDKGDTFTVVMTMRAAADSPKN